jgi:hypothetical protein
VSTTSFRIAAVGSGLVLALGAPAAAFASHANHGHHGQSSGHGKSASHAHGHGHGRNADHGKGHGHGKGHAKGHNKDKFTAVGTVASVDAAGGTVTVNDKGGTKALHGTTVTVSVPDTARVIVDDVDGSLSDVAAGDHIVVKGTASASYTATKVVASTPGSDDSSSDPTETTDPTDSEQ